ncbi:MAG: hypothetical protein F6K55_19305 [Moorea sp. SIO4A3]|nr:hypothetical protein [Moorena sp. SIO4A3]
MGSVESVGSVGRGGSVGSVGRGGREEVVLDKRISLNIFLIIVLMQSRMLTVSGLKFM